MAPAKESAGALRAERLGPLAAFLEAQNLALDDLGAVLPEDLDNAFGAAPKLSLGQRVRLRGLCNAARGQRGKAVVLRRLWGWSGWALLVLKFLTLYLLGVLCEVNDVWARFTEWGTRCEHHVASGNVTSGVKVLVAGFAKTGTRTLSRALYQFGMEHSYHSEDLSFFVWSRLADDFWAGQKQPPSFADRAVLGGTAPGQLAASLARCRVEAIAFDRMERLFWPVYRVSPEAKVISLHWRSFVEYRQSASGGFGVDLQLSLLLLTLLSSAQHLLPWTSGLKVLDRILSHYLEQLLRSGGPPLNQVHGLLVGLLHIGLNYRRIARHWDSGLAIKPEAEEEYDQFFEDVRKTVPRERLFEWDMRKHRWEDLCSFLGVSAKQCPGKGRLPRPVSTMNFEREFPIYFLGAVPIWLLLHWVNWQLMRPVFWALGWLLRLAWALVTWLLRRVWRVLTLLKWTNVLKLYFMTQLGMTLEGHGVWRRLGEFDGRCQYPPRNESGVKILVAGVAKTGTRTISRSLFVIGLERSYHSEDLGFFLWGHMFADHWRRLEKLRHLADEPPLSLMARRFVQENILDPTKNLNGMDVMQSTSPEVLARELSRCRTEAVALDGLEALFWPVYHASPGVKVISLNWRTYEEYLKSSTNFIPTLAFWLHWLGLIVSAQHVLPWGTLVRAIDLAAGGTVDTMLRTGKPPFNQVYTPLISLFHTTNNNHRILSHWSSGLGHHPRTEREYQAYFERVRQQVPPSRLFEWDMRKHTWEDLCRFVGVEECARSGKLPRAINLLNFERDFPMCFIARLPFYFICHRVNFLLVGAIFSMLRIIWGAVTRRPFK